MDTLTIIGEAVLKENETCGFAAVTISIKSYNYLCRMAMKPNVFVFLSDCLIEMDFTDFIDLIAIAHTAECEYHKVSNIGYLAI